MISQDIIITMLVLGTALATIVGLSIYERRPRDSLAPRMIPTGPIMLLLVFVAILAFVHLLNTIGIKTGS